MKKLTAIVAIYIAFFVLFSCSKNSTEPDPSSPLIVSGNLDITFQINQLWDPMPTNQTVIWLEDKNGNYIRSLFVSDYLAFGGHSHDYICPTWQSKVDWDDLDQNPISAVSGATPKTGRMITNSTILDSLELEEETYICNIETHILDEYNIFYSSELNFGKDANNKTPEPVFIPQQHDIAQTHLNSVEMGYTPAE